MIETLKRDWNENVAPFFERAVAALEDRTAEVDLSALQLDVSCPWDGALELIDPKRMHFLQERVREMSPEELMTLKSEIFRPYIEGWQRLIAALFGRYGNLPEIMTFRDALMAYSGTVQGAIAQQAVHREVHVDLQLDYTEFEKLKMAYAHIGDAIRRLDEGAPASVAPVTAGAADPYNDRKEAARRLRELVRDVKLDATLHVDSIPQAIAYIKDANARGPLAERCAEMRSVLMRWRWRDSYIVQMAKPASAMR